MIDETMICDDDFVIDEYEDENKCKYTLVKTVNPKQVGPFEPINICVTMTAIDEIPHVTLTDDINTKLFHIVDGCNTITEDCLSPGKSISVKYSAKPTCDLGESFDLDSRVIITYKKERNNEIDTYTDYNEKIDVCECPPQKKDEVFTACCCESKCKTVCLDSCGDSHYEKVVLDSIPCDGKILRVPLLIKDVCRNKDLAVAIFLKQKIYDTNKKPCYKDMGFKVIEIPAQKKLIKEDKCYEDKCYEDKDCKECTSCTDLKVNGVCFVLPVDLCDSQDIEIHVLANYLSFDYDPLSCKY